MADANSSGNGWDERWDSARVVQSAMKGEVESVEKVLGGPLREAALGAETAQAGSLLHAAVRGGHEDMVRLVLRAMDEAGMDVDVRDRNGDTALHVAAWRGYASVAILLLEAGASKSAMNEDTHLPGDLIGISEFANDDAEELALLAAVLSEPPPAEAIASDSDGAYSDTD